MRKDVKAGLTLFILLLVIYTTTIFSANLLITQVLLTKNGNNPTTQQLPQLQPGPTPDYYACDCDTLADPDCEPGNDNNDGLTQETAFQTYQKLRTTYNNLPAGSTVAFCKGGSFSPSGPDDTRWENSNCLANNRCTITDYTPTWGTGDEERPIITNLAGSGIKFQNGGDAEHHEGVNIRNLHLIGNTSEYARGNGIFWTNDIDYTLAENLLVEGFNIGFYIGGANLPAAAGSDGKNQDNIIRNSVIKNAARQGFLGGCTNCMLENNTFTNNGGKDGLFDHNIYVSGAGGSSNNFTVRGNTLYRSAIPGVEETGGQCVGTSLVVHGVKEDLLIEDNYIYEDIGGTTGGCWGIGVDGGYSEAEQFQNLIIRSNKLVNVGNMGIGCTSCQNATIENNIVIQEQTNYGTNAISIPDKTPSVEDSETTNVNVRGNTIYFGPGTSGTGIKVNHPDGQNYDVTSNLILYEGTNNGFNCLNVGSKPLSDFDNFDRNLCYYPNAPSAEWANGIGNLTEWQSASSFDTNSIEANPQLNNPTSDLTLQEGSPAINASILGLAPLDDHTGNYRDAIPDIGALEYGVSGGQQQPPPQNPVCGNGIIEQGEECDDGGTTSGDGCSATCQIETSTSCTEWNTPWQETVRVEDIPADLNEISGIEYSQENPGIIWAADDSGHPPDVYAINLNTGNLSQRYHLEGISNYDWEDMAIGPGPTTGKDYIYVLDDNAPQVIRFEEPQVPQTPQETINITDYEVFPFQDTVPTGSDGEVLIVDQQTGTPYFINFAETVYKFPTPLSNGTIVTLEYVTNLSTPVNGTSYRAGDVTPTNDRIILREYDDIYEFTRPQGGSFEDMFSQTPCITDSSGQGQAEAITYAQNSETLIAISEGNAPWIRLLTGTTPTPICGNGIVETGEQCDDGGTSSGDGCSATCQEETGWTCTGQPSTCNLTQGGDDSTPGGSGGGGGSGSSGSSGSSSSSSSSGSGSAGSTRGSSGSAGSSGTGPQTSQEEQNQPGTPQTPQTPNQGIISTIVWLTTLIILTTITIYLVKITINKQQTTNKKENTRTQPTIYQQLLQQQNKK